MTIYYTSIYNDKTKFTFSVDEAGKGDYAKIDRSKLVALEIYNDAHLIHRLHLEPGQRLILRGRVVKKLQNSIFFDDKNKNASLEDLPGKLTRIILCGYQENVKGESRQSMMVIFLDDFHTEHISEWKANPLNAVILLDQEKPLEL